jgi:hypothetical protein
LAAAVAICAARFGFAWLTPEGEEIAIQELGLLRAEHMEAAE